jgi:hypothetical protein
MAWFKLLLGAVRAHPFEAAANRNKSCNFIKATKAATREMRWRDCCQLDGYYYCYYSLSVLSLPWHIAQSSGVSTLDVCRVMLAPKTLSSLLFWVLTAVKLTLYRDSAQWRLNYKIPSKPQPPQRHAMQFAHSSNARENFGVKLNLAVKEELELE